MKRTWRRPSPADDEKIEPGIVFQAGLRNHHICNTAYPIAHGETWAPYRVAPREHASLVRRAWDGISDLCAYVHIPFCETRCAFCEYTVVGRAGEDVAAEYVDDLLTELELYRAIMNTGRCTLHGLDIGGGTPSSVPAEEIARIVAEIRAVFHFAPGADISIETTPKIAAAEASKLAAYRRCGIERISMGVQVVQPELLRALDRSENGVAIHQRAVANIRAAGFRRFNVDLMYGFAGQSLESWRATLQHAIDLGSEYITLYRMRYKLSRLSHQARRVSLDHVRSLAGLSGKVLAAARFDATPGKTTWSRIPGDVGTSSYLRHRVVDGMPYLGLGLGAQSFTHRTISYNLGAACRRLAPYRSALRRGRIPIQDLYDLPARQMMAKMCAVSLYFGEIDSDAFQAKFGVSLDDAYADEVAFAESHGLMERVGRSLRLTPRGAADENGVHALFHAPAVQRYLIARHPGGGDGVRSDRRPTRKASLESAHV